MGRKWGKRSAPPPPIHPELDRRLARLGTIAEGNLTAHRVGHRDAKVIGVGPMFNGRTSNPNIGITMAIEAGNYVHGVQLTRREAVNLTIDILESLQISPEHLAELREDT